MIALTNKGELRIQQKPGHATVERVFALKLWPPAIPTEKDTKHLEPATMRLMDPHDGLVYLKAGIAGIYKM